MNTVNLLDFLSESKDLNTLDYIKCDMDLLNFLDLFTEEEEFTQKINLGIFFIDYSSMGKVVIVDGINRLLSLSLLLHAVCECYKKTTPKNEKAIKVIRSKYLLNGTKTKLRLPKKEQEIYEKIIFGEHLSGREKETPIFVLLHNFWSQIKQENLTAARIFAMLQKIQIITVDVDNTEVRDLYYCLNKDKAGLDHLLLIGNYMKKLSVMDEWNAFKEIFHDNKADIYRFFKDFYVTVFKYKEFKEDRAYETFVNYFDTMLKYKTAKDIIKSINKTAFIYKDIVNVNIDDDEIKKGIINIKMHNGEDTYSYILCLFEDYIDGNISRVVFLEILSTIDEYLRNRLKTPNEVSFNELIKYLNAFLTCK